MLVLMPLMVGQTIPQEVLAGVAQQAVPVRLLVVTNQPLLNYRDGVKTGLSNALEAARAIDSQALVAFVNRDVVLAPSTVELLATALHSDERIGTVHVRPDNVTFNPRHFDCGCMGVRLTALEGLSFDQSTWCSCPNVTARVLARGYVQEWLPGQGHAYKIKA